jgi:replicative DNA helicase
MWLGIWLTHIAHAKLIRRGDLKERDYEKIKQTSAGLQNLPFYVDQTGGLLIGQLTARARRLKPSAWA